MWILVVCSQIPFHVTRARKDDKNRQNTLLHCKKNMNLLHDKQLFNKSPSGNNNNSPPITVNQTKKVKLIQTWDKRIRFLLADDLGNIIKFQIILLKFNLLSTTQVYSTYSQLTENHDLFSLQQRNPADCRFWTRLCCYCSN